MSCGREDSPKRLMRDLNPEAEETERTELCLKRMKCGEGELARREERVVPANSGGDWTWKAVVSRQ